MGKFVSEKIRKKSSARLAAVQATYMAAYGQLPLDEVVQDFLQGKIGDYLIEEDSLGTEENVPVEPMDKEYFEHLIRGVQTEKENLEKSLNMFLSEGRTLDSCDGTLQALLLCAMYEIANTRDLDVKVIIQEYVDMAYAFFSKN